MSDVANDAISDLGTQLGVALAHLAVARAHIRSLSERVEVLGQAQTDPAEVPSPSI